MVRVISVTITRVLSQAEPSSTQLEYEVWNQTQAPIWLVSDDWLIWHQNSSQIELSYIRGKMQPGTQVFGYFPPSVLRIDPGRTVTQVVQLLWPQTLDRLWNVEEWATPLPGRYQIAVRVGYGLTPEPDAPKISEGVEAPIFRWQKEAVSQTVPMEVCPYESTEALI